MSVLLVCCVGRRWEVSALGCVGHFAFNESSIIFNEPALVEIHASTNLDGDGLCDPYFVAAANGQFVLTDVNMAAVYSYDFVN